MIEHRRERHPALRRDVLVELDARQRQEILDQTRHPRRLPAHDREKPLARFGVIARRPAQGLDKAGQCGERGAQLVTRIGDEVGAHLFGTLQFGNVVQAQHRDRAVGRGLVDAGKAGAQLALDRDGQGELNHARGFTAQHFIRRRQQDRVAQGRGEVAWWRRDADKIRGGGVRADDPPPLVEQD